MFSVIYDGPLEIKNNFDIYRRKNTDSHLVPSPRIKLYCLFSNFFSGSGGTVRKKIVLFEVKKLNVNRGSKCGSVFFFYKNQNYFSHITLNIYHLKCKIVLMFIDEKTLIHIWKSDSRLVPLPRIKLNYLFCGSVFFICQQQNYFTL